MSTSTMDSTLSPAVAKEFEAEIEDYQESGDEELLSGSECEQVKGIYPLYKLF